MDWLSALTLVCLPRLVQLLPWTKNVEEVFKLAKQKIIEAVTNGDKHFEVGRETCLATDWSKQGNSFFLMQKWCQCEKLHPSCCPKGWRLVLAGIWSC